MFDRVVVLTEVRVLLPNIELNVGINRVEGKTVGDVDYEAVAKKAARITPVPGGVGPLTVSMVLSQTVSAAENSLIKGRSRRA